MIGNSPNIKGFFSVSHSHRQTFITHKYKCSSFTSSFGIQPPKRAHHTTNISKQLILQTENSLSPSPSLFLSLSFPFYFTSLSLLLISLSLSLSPSNPYLSLSHFLSINKSAHLLFQTFGIRPPKRSHHTTNNYKQLILPYN